MGGLSGKRIVIGIIILVLIGVGIFAIVSLNKKASVPEPVKEEPKPVGPKHETIGKSVEGRKIDAYTYGTGKKHLVFVGGIHGGYEWNSVLLAYQLMDYMDKNLNFVSSDLSVTVIPSMNPDAVFKVVGKEGRFSAADVSKDKTVLAAARFNANKVDLNRNFDCKWKPTATWQNKTVSAGTKAFSEPESEAIRNYALTNHPDMFLFWHSQANAAYASSCRDGILPETTTILNTFSKASGYPAAKTFDSYEITGDVTDWLASQKIPAISVELKNHESTDWDQNLKGIRVLLDYFEKR